MSSLTNPYAEAHASPKSAGDARPTALQVIQDEDLINKMTDKVMIVTGSSSGIGVETSRALHATGAHIFMQVRDMKKGKAVMENILASSQGTGKLELLMMDLGSFESIRKGATDFLKRSDKLNVLVNNAGIRNPPEGTTVDGYETQFGTNHLGHFLLFQLLRPMLLSSSTPTFASRIINVTSGSHRDSPINFFNLNLKGIYTPRLGYAQSKTANILMANQMERLYGSKGLHGLSVHPGCIITGAQRHDDPAVLKARLESDKTLMMVLKSTEQGAATTVWAAVAKVWEGKGARYLEDCREGVKEEMPDLVKGGYKSFCFDEEAERKLWDVSCEMVGVEKGV